jgi:glutamate-1-semialdehyde 2,1-aminomutase
MTVTAGWTQADLARVDQVIAEQEQSYLRRQIASREKLGHARRNLAGGATSSWQITKPQMIWMQGGKGSKVVDVDGLEYVDMNGGYGVGIVGHAHPRVVEAVSDRVRFGTHFAQPTEDAVVVAEELARRFGLPLWRFNNSGTEATMDAVHLMRAVTGRDKIVKVEGCYHGHHDSVMVSVVNEGPEIGPPEAPHNPISGSGIPRAIAELTIVVPYNDLDALERVFAGHDGEIAGMILEPIMMNAGIIPPEEGYLEGVRAITRSRGALLAFDEVKTGLTVGPGGATGLFGVIPDLVCLAKALGGGVPCGAIGGSDEVMQFIVDGRYEQVGTFNGNPLTMASARATLTEVLTDEAYAHLTALQARMIEGCRQIIDRYALPAYPSAFGAKGSITFAPTKVRNYRDFLGVDDRLGHAHWLIQHAGRVLLPPWGKAEQWLLSVQHTEEDVGRFVDNFDRLATALRP